MAQSRKELLIQELHEQRRGLTQRFHSVKQELNPVHQLQLNFRKHPIRWAAAAAGSAFVATRLLRRKKIIYQGSAKSGGFLLRGGKLLFTLARPALTTFALSKAKEHLEARLNPPADNSMLGGTPQK